MVKNARIPQDGCYRVKARGDWPKGKHRTLSNRFEKRQQARQFCRNHRHEYQDAIIIHPDGTEEPFVWDGD